MTKTSQRVVATKGGKFDKPNGGIQVIKKGDELVGRQAEAALANGWGKIVSDDPKLVKKE